jgi:hypothetical protein
MLASRAPKGLDFLTDAALEPDQVAEIVLREIRDEKFLILPHPGWLNTLLARPPVTTAGSRNAAPAGQHSRSVK